jgi:plastocyanin
MKKFSGRRRYVAALAASAGLVAVAACSGATPHTYGSNTEPSTQPSSPAKSMPTKPMGGMSIPSTPGAGAVLATKSVSIKNFAFRPASITVKVRTTVTWTNGDQDPHNVTGGPLRSATMHKGNTYKYTFTKTGRYAYKCTIHPFMTGTVVVTP